nr:PadR family transcriptional regulator [Bacilli bacterium]
MSLPMGILGFLMKGERSGYDIRQLFQESIGFFYNTSYGGIYPALNKLEKEGNVQKTVVPQAGKPNKNLYSITKRGQEVFEQYMRSPMDPTIVYSDFLLRVFFAQYISQEEYRSMLLEELKRTKESFQALQKVEQTYEVDVFERFTMQFGLSYFQHFEELLVQEIRRLDALQRPDME